jgi:putative hydroxymethylpyrimidine transport system substrate-binding protein
MKMLRAKLTAVAAAVLLAGCGGGSSGEASGETEAIPLVKQELVLSTDGPGSPENVGILMAQNRGYFEKAGISLWFRPPVSPTRPISYLVGSGEVDLAISHAPQVAISRDKGVPVMAIGSLVDQPTAAMIWLAKSRIGNIADLRGRTIAFPGLPFQKALLESFLARGGLSLDDVKLRAVGYELVPTLVKGEADAIFGGSWNMEGIQLKAMGAKPSITRVEVSGVPSYDELVLIGRSDYLTENAPLVRRFLDAVARGTQAAMANPKAATRVVMANDIDRKLKATEAEVKATLPLLSESGEMDPDRWEELVTWMHDQGTIEGSPSASELLTDEYLPSQP